MKKAIYLLILITLISCAQSTEKNKETSVFSEEVLVDEAMKTLGIEKSKTHFVVSKASPNNTEETIIIIPEVINEDEDVYELNGNILIVDNTTGKQSNTYFESPKENGWISDAIFIQEIAIDTLAYKFSDTATAFGITTSFRSSSQPNPYNTENISLYIKEGSSLKKILDTYTIYESFGEVNVNINACYADIKNTINALTISDTITNGYFDIHVKRTLSQVLYAKDEEGECNPKKKVISIEDVVLKYNGNSYKEATRTNRKIIKALDFNEAISNMKTKDLPHIEATNFDSFIDEDDYNNVDVQALKIESIYPNFYKQGYNYRAVTSYKINLSDVFHSAVITVKKGDNEMETILINYNLRGDIIDHQLIAYDEIAEGMFQTQSKIMDNKLIVNQIAWREEPQIERLIYEFTHEGIIEELNSEVLNDEIPNIPLVMIALDKLKLNMLNVKIELITSNEHPDNPDDIIMVIPEIVEEGEYYLELNNHVLIINSRSGEVMQKTVVKGLTSDAIVLKDIAIDTGPYLVTENTHAFGILIHRYGESKANPYENKNLELFVKSGETLNSVLYNFDIKDYGGERVSDCEGEFIHTESILTPLTTKTNGFFDIQVETMVVDTESFLDEDGICNATDKHSTQTKLLKYNGSVYREEGL